VLVLNELWLKSKVFSIVDSYEIIFCVICRTAEILGVTFLRDPTLSRPISL
jgi:hypothetical protein